MKKLLCVILTIGVLLSLAACGKQPTDKPAGEPVENPDITMEQIDWTVEEGEWEKDRYVLCRFTNKSKYTITSFKLSFVAKPDLTQDEFENFYAEIQVSQGFGDEFMQSYIKDRDQKGLPITMYAQADIPVKAGETAEEIKCYYLGGFTSKNLIFQELFVPESATFSYEKGGETYTISYDFETGNYVTVEMQGD